MSKQLKKAFESYCQIVIEKVVKPSKISPNTGNLNIIANEDYYLRSVVETIETHRSFDELIRISTNVFADHLRLENPLLEHINIDGIYYDDIGCFKTTQNFFRRSYFYRHVYNGESIDIAALFEDYCNTFRKEEVKMTHILAFENVLFDKNMDFGDFKIQKFGEKIEKLLEIENNRVFYPQSNFPMLQDSWLIIIEDTERMSEKAKKYHDSFYDDQGDRTKLQNVFSEQFPACIQNILELLSLYFWRIRKSEDVVMRKERIKEVMALIGVQDFDNIAPTPKTKVKENKKKSVKIIEDLYLVFEPVIIKHVLSFTDNLLVPPYTFVGRWDGPIEPYIMPEEFGSYPNPRMYTLEGNDFKSELFKIKKKVEYLQEYESKWPFVRLALKYFEKAFRSSGIEQLLWHIIAIESLVGKQNETREALAKRISVVLYDTESEKEATQALLKDIYDFRNNLVHGNIFDKELHMYDLDIARNIARKTLLWFVEFAYYMRNKIEQSESVSKDDIHRLLDMGKSGLYSTQNSTQKLLDLFDLLPLKFPRWLS